jgi:hypothetical protein
MGYLLKHETAESALAGASALAQGGPTGKAALVTLPNALRMGRAKGDEMKSAGPGMSM